MNFRFVDRPLPRVVGPWEGDAATLRLRTEASAWAFHNVFASEMRDQLDAMRLPELLNEVGDDEGDDADEADAIEYRKFPAQSGWSHHWSNVATPKTNARTFRAKTLYARFAGDDVRHATEANVDRDFSSRDLRTTTSWVA